MELNFCDLKKKRVVNILDGKELGKVGDLLFTWPEGRLVAFIVGEKKLFSSGDELLINTCCVNKIGNDTVLVSLGKNEARPLCQNETEE